MTLEERMAKMEAAYGTQSELMRELRDAVTVTAHLEARQGKVLMEHGEWLAAQKDEQRKSRAEFDERMKILDERITKLVSAFGAFLARDAGSLGGKQ